MLVLQVETWGQAYYWKIGFVKKQKINKRCKEEILNRFLTSSFVSTKKEGIYRLKSQVQIPKNMKKLPQIENKAQFLASCSKLTQFLKEKKVKFYPS